MEGHFENLYLPLHKEQYDNMASTIPILAFSDD